MLLAAQGVEKKAEELFPSIAAIRLHASSQKEDSNDLMVQAQKLKSSGFLARLQAAAASNNVDWNVS